MQQNEHSERGGTREPGVTRRWFLEGYLEHGRCMHRLAIHPLPYRIGREESLELCIEDGEISRRHAQLELRDDVLVIRDLGSTNGTSVNHDRIRQATALREGDILHLGPVELRVASGPVVDPSVTTEMTHLRSNAEYGKLPTGTRELAELLDYEQVTTLFQPLFTPAGDIHGWELLGRGTHPGLSASPLELFHIAESMGREVELSSLFRRKGIAVAHATRPDGRYFVNTHPREIENLPQFMQAMRALRHAYPELNVVVELHEAAFADLDVLAELRADLLGLGMSLAFDDFGAGQSRLAQVVEVPPRYIKVDIALIRGLDRAPPARRHMLEMVLRIAHGADSLVVAEGVSQEGELAACRDMGFDLVQGFLMARPHSAEQLALDPSG